MRHLDNIEVWRQFVTQAAALGVEQGFNKCSKKSSEDLYALLRLMLGRDVIGRNGQIRGLHRVYSGAYDGQKIARQARVNREMEALKKLC